MPQTLTLDEANRLLEQSGENVTLAPKVGTTPPKAISLDQANQVLANEQARDDEGWLMRQMRAVRDVVAGNATMDLPELANVPAGDLGMSVGDSLDLAGSFILEPSVEGKVAIIKDRFPDARFSRDDNGNIFTEINGQRAYVNQPGASVQDFNDVASEIVKFLPSARIMGGLTKGAAPLTKFAAQFTGEGVASIGFDELAKAVGSDQPTDFGEAFLAGVGAGTFEIAAPVLGKLVTKVFKGEGLSRAERGELIVAGIDPDKLTPQAVEQVIMNRNAGTPDARKRLFESVALPESIPRTRGDLEQSAPRILQETEAVKISEGAAAAQRQFKDRQQDAIAKNIERLRQQFSGVEDFRSPAQIGQEVQEKLVRYRADAGQSVADAYKAASEGKVFMPNSALKDASTNMRKVLEREEIFVDDIPAVKSFLNRFDDRRLSITKPSGQQGIGEVKLKANLIEKAIKDINQNIIGTAGTNQTQKYAGKKMSQALRKQLEDYIDGGLLEGSPEAIKQLSEGRKQSRLFKEIFEKNDIVELITKPRKDVTEQQLRETVRDQGFSAARESRLLQVDPDDAVNAIFAKSAIQRKGVASDIKKLKSVLGEEDFGLLKESAFLKMIGQGAEEGTFSGARFRKNLQKTINENPELMKEMFNQDEMRVMQRFAKVVDEIQNPPKNAVNRSNTAAATAVQRGLNKFFGSAGEFATGFIKNSSGGRAVRESGFERNLGGQLQRNRRAIDDLAPATGAATGDERIEDDFEPFQGIQNRAPANEGSSLDPETSQRFSALRQRANEIRKQQEAERPTRQSKQRTAADRSGVRDIIRDAAEVVGEDDDLAIRIASAESSLKPGAKAKTSSATGLFQITQGTWNALVRKYGKQLGVGYADRDDPRANSLMGMVLTKENRANLRGGLGREPTDGEVYAAHFMGAGSAKKLIKNRNSGSSAVRAFPKAAKSNPNIFYDKDGRERSIAEVYQLLERKVA